ncbi:MAG: SAM-dependent methyltransferase [Deltaproteobacteria bacterium CG_4_8_14_3_um_filter_45_9]|nr:MAG: SAM-dependent methyltransferase [Deltaproteobacteria bacterium CG03_land_8_20_14_0_80_45_14]PIX26694.1 MAG: SAM-dependent methyltransferase [Deltaproteobacteria bacterium CG_4_8_14_3_um_filter_45_9]
MEKERIIKIYSRYSYIYDLIFSHMITPRIKSGLKKMGIKEGDLIIEAGVGTGLSLPLYPNFCRVVGIDITRKMLDKAKIKKNRFNLHYVDLIEMDAEHLTFCDDIFDHAVLPFVLSVVSNPEKMVSEIKRVTKKNGKIIVINHFSSNNPFLLKMERFFSPVFIRLGWETGFTTEFLSNHCHLCIKEVSRDHRFDSWLIVYATNKK